MAGHSGGKNVTIIDVAERAGVSRATASRALSNYGRIAQDTVDRVKQAAEELGYRPNQIARSMRQGSTKTIGLVIIADFTNAFFDRVTKGIVDTARSLGYQVLISNTDEHLEVERVAVQTLIEKQVDGLIVVPSSPVVFDHLTPKALNSKPLVLIDRMVEGLKVTSVTTDDFVGAEEAIRNAVSLGHDRFGFLIATETVSGRTYERPAALISTVAERANGFMSGAIDAGIKPKQMHWIYLNDDPHVAELAVVELLDRPKPPSVIFTSNNDMALAALKVIGNRGLQLGRDISLVTVDDSLWLEAFRPGITVVERPVEQLAQTAVQKLIEEIESPGQKPEKIVMPTRLLARGSVANLKLRPELRSNE